MESNIDKENNEEESEHIEDGYLDTFIDDSLENDNEEEESLPEEQLTEKEIEDLIAELLEVESKAAEAQEALEEESLVKVEADVRKEFAQSLFGDDLEKAVLEEMSTFKEEWEAELDGLETESAHLLEQLDGAGIELPSLYKCIEIQAPNGCCTEAWKKRTHWVGMEMPLDVTESVAQAEEYLRTHRPVRRRHGKILEEGASGFLGKKFVMNDGINANRDSFSKMCSDRSSLEDVTFGSKHWPSVYLASNPQQAAELGLKFPGVDEVEEIDDVDDNSSDPFIADAVANERDQNLTEDQKRNFRKVKEEDDVYVDLKLRNYLKSRRRKHCKEEAVQKELCSADELKECQSDGSTAHGSNSENDYRPSTAHDGRNLKNDYKLMGEVTDFVESRGFKCSGGCGELQSDHKKCCTIAVDSDSEAPSALNKISPMEEVTSSKVQLVSSSDSGSDDSDADVYVHGSTKRRCKKKIRRILDDAELGEETKKRIAIEKERQERLKSLEARISTKSAMMSSVNAKGSSFDGSSVEMLGDISGGYIVNVAREEGEEAVRIPPSISVKLKLHQIAGIRFMWENIIQLVHKVKSGDKGLGCILAHTMGLGKTIQVIAFLYMAMRGADLGLKTALIVTPVSVLHNWRHEFIKWRPSELKPLRIFMLEDVPRMDLISLSVMRRT